MQFSILRGASFRGLLAQELLLISTDFFSHTSAVCYNPIVHILPYLINSLLSITVIHGHETEVFLEKEQDQKHQISLSCVYIRVSSSHFLLVPHCPSPYSFILVFSCTSLESTSLGGSAHPHWSFPHTSTGVCIHTRASYCICSM